MDMRKLAIERPRNVSDIINVIRTSASKSLGCCGNVLSIHPYASLKQILQNTAVNLNK
jgi:hypothetical protein